MGSFQIYTAFKQSRTERARYYNVSLGKRVAMGAAFLFLLAVTSIGMVAMHGPLQGL
jgi:hypothetical protein